MNFKDHLMRQIAWSRATFGPTTRGKGVIDHIRKELVEVETAANNQERVKEWTDIAILALDGLWREIAYGFPGAVNGTDTASAAAEVIRHITAKQGKNELRNWPDWRTASPDKAIEHVK